MLRILLALQAAGIDPGMQTGPWRNTRCRTIRLPAWFVPVKSLIFAPCESPKLARRERSKTQVRQRGCHSLVTTCAKQLALHITGPVVDTTERLSQITKQLLVFPATSCHARILCYLFAKVVGNVTFVSASQTHIEAWKRPGPIEAKVGRK